MYKTETEFGHNLIDFWKMSSFIELKLIARKNKTLRFRSVYGIKSDLNKLNNYTAEWVFQLIINYLIENRFSEKCIKAEEPFWIYGLKIVMADERKLSVCMLSQFVCYYWICQVIN